MANGTTVKLQANTEVEPKADLRKYEAGRTLTFRSYDPDEVEALGRWHRYVFRRGQRLRVLPRNGCGMGVDVERISDGAKDMVWPTEVQVTQCG